MSVQLAPEEFATPDRRGFAHAHAQTSQLGSEVSEKCSTSNNQSGHRSQGHAQQKTHTVTPPAPPESSAREQHQKRQEEAIINAERSIPASIDGHVSPHLPRSAKGRVDSPSTPQAVAGHVSQCLPMPAPASTATTLTKTRNISTSSNTLSSSKHVRFGEDDREKLHDSKMDREGDQEAPITSGNAATVSVIDSNTSNATASQRGLVSRRGGRYVSPGRTVLKPNTMPSPKNIPLAPSKVFESPSVHLQKDENDTVPSLCSTKSEELASAESDKEKSDEPTSQAQTPVCNAVTVEVFSKDANSESFSDLKPSSISCDASMIDSTSPLASCETVASESAKLEDAGKKNSMVFSPRPTRDSLLLDKSKKTPIKSPCRFQALPSLDDARGVLSSPGIFLSPGTYKTIQGSFDKSEAKEEKTSENDTRPSSDPKKHQERASTPTDFAIDYGKGHPMLGSFDTSNVLAWLQSPTANGLFSPGGLSSIMNTPRGLNAPRTPRTPTISTSFFFSDVDGLPRGIEFTPKADQAGKKPQKGYSNIIRISPLASSRNRHGAPQCANTPLNFKDIFASPRPNSKSNPQSLPLLGDSPKRLKAGTDGISQRSKDSGADHMDLEDRDMMEDEDLSVLLQLASNTPRSTGTSGTGSVFRSPGARGDEQYGKVNGSSNSESLPALQLPLMGREGESAAARLSRKSHSRDDTDGNGFAAPTLGMRSSSSGSKELYIDKGSRKMSKEEQLPFVGSNASTNESKSNNSAKKNNKKASGANNTYSAPPQYAVHPGQDVSYYPMPGGMPGMPPGGNMRVVVGGPPPNRNIGKSTSGSTPPPRHSSTSPHNHHPPYRQGDNPYPPPSMSYPPPPPPGHYAHHPHVPPHMSSMGVHPYHGHYPPHPPPPRHMPMYGAQHKPGANGSKLLQPKKGKPGKPPKPSAKRPNGLLDPPCKGSNPSNTTNLNSAKKQKKAPPTGPVKKKNKSPQLTDRADRQKAAATIAAVNAASGGKNDRAAALAAAILRGVTMRPSGKWQAQLYFAGKSRYIGVFDTREKAALAYEIAREKLKSEKSQEPGGLSPQLTEAAVNSARKAAFEGVNERDPRISSK